MSARATNKKVSKKPKNTQLTDIMSLPSDEAGMKAAIQQVIVFDAPVYGVAPSDDKITFWRVNISIRNPDGTEGDIVIDLDRSFSFGTSEFKQENGTLNGYSTAISLYDRDGATERQVRSVLFIRCLSEVVKDHLLTEEFKEATELFSLKDHHLEKLDPIYYKKGDKGKLLMDQGGTFYPKLSYFKASKDKKTGKERPAAMGTKYYLEDEVDENGEQVEVDPLDFLGTRHYITAAIKFSSIFLGAKTKNMQCSVYEAEVKAADMGKKRLLKVAGGSSRAPTVVVNGANPLLKKSDVKAVSDSKEDELVKRVAKVEIKSEEAPVKRPVMKIEPSDDVPDAESGVEVEADLQVSEDEEDKPKKTAKRTIKKKVPAAKKE